MDERIRRWDRSQVAMALFLSSEAIFFGALLTGYLVYRGNFDQAGPWSLEVARTALFTVFLLASSAFIVVAGRRLKRDDRRGAGIWIAATVVLGVIFLVGQATEFQTLVGEGITPASSLFGTTFYTLTGFHGLHVIAGLIALVLLAALALRGRLTSRQHGGFEAVSIYWHFVDVVWIVIFSVVYLWNIR